MDLIIKLKSNLLDACIYPFMDYCTLYASKDLFKFINSFWLLIVLAQVIIQERVLIFIVKFYIHENKHDNYNLCIFNVLKKEYSIIVNCLSMINNLVIRYALRYVYDAWESQQVLPLEGSREAYNPHQAVYLIVVV